MASSSVLPHIPEANRVPFQLGTYVCVVEVTAYFYDWLWSISDECKIMSRAGLTLSVGVYLLSRISTAGQLLMIAVLLFAPVEDCSALIAMLATCAAVTVASTSFLFFLRVRAVYLQSRYITALFGLLWVITVAFNTLADVSLRAVRIPDTLRCIVYETDYYAYPSVATFLNDTCVFLAISYRLTGDTAIEKSWRGRLLSIVTGKGLYRLSRALMQTGFIYYL
ncbi:hypothetical protein FIBSPDRAFT_928240 [Athelia psychrophila]|uniref:DUF6533 domain-containing protein n=1 Tax=Athelia psychrophila TaxID=1759441 RepID=A0A166QEV4_9AGAM|nr:hypothetical protein FIBSPDRAFT_928240 [Fibularhizoctonia sp. CBS 109695]